MSPHLTLLNSPPSAAVTGLGDVLRKLINFSLKGVKWAVAPLSRNAATWEHSCVTLAATSVGVEVQVNMTHSSTSSFFPFVAAAFASVCLFFAQGGHCPSLGPPLAKQSSVL